MKTLAQRSLLILVALLLGMLPLSGSAMGGGGDTGVWILPRSAFIANLPNGPGGSGTTSSLVGPAPRAQATRPLSSSLSMQVSGAMSLPPAAVLVDPVSGVPLPLDVVGGVVTVTSRLAALVATSATNSMSGAIVDARGRGYTLLVSVDAVRQTVTVQVW